MRASFVSQDRADLGEAVKSLAQGMAAPTEANLLDLKKLARYLVGRPYVALRYYQQSRPRVLKLKVDSDHAADKKTRRSTTGCVALFGEHVVKTTSNLQSAIGLNVSESEYYALCHGGAHGLGLQAFLNDLGVKVEVEVQSDSSSARSFASRQGLGKQRHVQTRYLWLQERVALKHLSVKKIRGEDNDSDVLTKAVAAPTMQKHMRSMGYVDVERSRIQKTLQSSPSRTHASGHGNRTGTGQTGAR